MKNTIKFLGIIALVAIIGFSFTACGDDDDNSGGNNNGSDTAVTFSGVTANGDATTTTTQLTLTFSAAITGLAAGDITLSGVSGVSKGTLGGAGPTYTLGISGVTAGGTLSVAVAKSGYAVSGSPKTATIYYYSGSGGNNDPASAWTAITPANSGFGDSSNNINAIAFGGTGLNRKFVAVGQNGKIATSSNGTTWTPVAASPFDNETAYRNTIISVAYGYNRFVVGGQYDGNTAYSDDYGITWTPVKTGNAFKEESVYAITYGQAMFVAVGGVPGGAHPSKIAISSDGRGWTALTSDTTFGNTLILAIAYGNNKFVTVGDAGKMATSVGDGDKITWTTVANTTFGDTPILGITWNGSKFVAVGQDGKIATSPDGTTWTAATTNLGDRNFRGVAWGGPSGQQKFVAVADQGRMAYSADGVTWTTVSGTDSTFGTNATDLINGIVYGDTRFVAVGQGGKMAYMEP